MKLGIYGLGYVGCVAAVCLAQRGHWVIGVDINEDKVQSLRQGVPPIAEAGLAELTSKAVANGSLTATGEVLSTVSKTDLSIVCVGTPSSSNGSLSTHFLEQVTRELGKALASIDRWHVIAYRSTMLPGTCEEVLIPLLEQCSGKRAGVDFGVALNPEFLREGTSVDDFMNPSKTLVGATDGESLKTVTDLYEGLPGPRYAVPIRVAEMSKYAENAFHALKVCFANEIGVVCTSYGVDSHAVMDLLVADTKLNISPAYLRPGFSFGGSCLPKDVRALNYAARKHDLTLPVLENILPSNERHVARVVEMAVADGRPKVGIFGLSFKAGTDDLRESPMVDLAERLVGKGFQVKIYDRNVSLPQLIGDNRDHIAHRLPHLGQLMVDSAEDVVRHSDIVIVCSSSPDVVGALDQIDKRQLVIDLVRVPNAELLSRVAHYVGVAW